MMKRRLYLLLAFAVASFVSIANAANSGEVIPADGALRQGVLSNSLHYYIRHNAKPAGQADFYILSDVGAIQEDDDQQGLAHFMEHMAFNGTRNLPDKMLIEYLESIGVKFGANLNASTSWDQTIYLMQDVPVKRESVVDSTLLILHDWAGFIEPKVEEIDKERGVIKEELRTRDGAGWRSTMKLVGTLGRGTKYEHRNIIGYLDYLESFEPEALVRFYHDWYRPDYQAIIVVGDIDVDSVERKIIELFEDLPAAAADAPQKEVIRVPDNEEPIIEVYADPELQYSSIQYFIKREARVRDQEGTVSAAREDILDTMIEMMQGSRFDEVVMSPDSPIMGASMGVGKVGVIPTLEATSYMVQSGEGELMEALQETVEQMERTRRYGFKEGEFERAKRSLLRGSESIYLNRNDRTNSSFVGQYMSNYRFGTAIPSAEQRWQLDSLLINEVTLDDVNARIGDLFSDNNHVVVLFSPKKEGLDVPTDVDVLAVIEGVQGSDIEEYEDKSVDDQLLPDGVELGGAAVVETTQNEIYGATEWVLANGVRVIVKPTDLKADEVLLSAYSDGGNSQLSDDRYFSGSLLSTLLSRSGLGEYTAIELERALTGHIVSLSTWVSDYSHGLSGFSSPADIKTLFEMLYLKFTAPRFDSDDFATTVRQLRANVENRESDPDYAHSKRFSQVVYNDNIRRRPFDMDVVNSLELDHFKEVYDKLYSDADNFTFMIVGSVDLETLKPLVETYLGSLPVVKGDAKMEYVDEGLRPVKGRVRDDFSTSMEQPKVGVVTMISGSSIDYTMEFGVIGNYFETTLDDLLLKSVREELGGTYGVSTTFSISDTPYERYTLSFSYDTNEEQFELLQSTVFEQLEIIARDGATPEQMSKCREYLLKNFSNSKENNSGWARYIKAYDTDGFDYLSDYERIVNGVTSDDVRRMARRILKDRNRVEVIMHPAK